MDGAGWVYLFLSSFFHAALLLLVPYIVICLPMLLLGVRQSICTTVLAVIYGFATLFFVVNRFVFQIYHFHINGFVLDMLFSEGAGDIFVFSFSMYVKAALILLGVCVFTFALWYASSLLAAIKQSKKFRTRAIVAFILLAIASQGMHIYGAAALHTSILESDAYLPYYFPITMNSALDKMGIIDKESISTIKLHDKASKLNYPSHPLEHDTSLLHDGKNLNIVLIVIDSWNYRTLTPECMPNLWAFMQESEYYSNHLSSSNGTRGGIFGLFTGISSYYWKSFEYSSLRPVLVDQLIDNGYSIYIYPSASFKSPPFDRMFFKGIDINTSTEGKTAYDRDCQLTADFVELVRTQPACGNPTFTFLFYDLAHAIALPKDKNTHFQPTWEYTDYTKLSNSTDPEPFFNLYRNCLYQIDSLLGIVFESLKASGRLENTIVLITGDHGQEFNENHKNYWGHSGNYTKYQIQVPLVLHYPGVTAAVHNYRTTHYDVVPTLLRMALGVSNPPSNYSMGVPLQDSTSRGWHIVGNDIDYAFITEDGHIIEKKGSGYVKVYDQNLNLQKDYKLSPKQVNDNLLKLNHFLK